MTKADARALAEEAIIAYEEQRFGYLHWNYKPLADFIADIILREIKRTETPTTQKTSQ